MIADIRQRLDRVPFAPFVIRTSDGHEYRVPTVDHAKIHPRGHRIAVFDDDGTTALLGPLHINSIIDQQSNGD